MAEAGAPEETMKALLGHMSRQMLERYSHIRIQAKRAAVEALTLPALHAATHKSPHSGNSGEEISEAKLLQ